MKAGVYPLTADAYYADQLDGQTSPEITLNATVCKLLINESALHAWTHHPRLNPDYRETIDTKFDLGTVAHEVFLLDNAEHVRVVDADDWRTKAAREARDQAHADGNVPLLGHEWKRVNTMLDALRDHLATIHADPPLFAAAGKPEQTLIWQDRGVWCRARMDWLHDSLGCCDDLKTAGRSANPHVWTRTTMWGIGADIQAAFTLRGLRAALGVDSTFRFVIAETHEPYAISAIELGAAALTLANAKIDVALERWKECLRTGIWPSYPPRVLTVEPPPWAESQWWEQQQVAEDIAA